MTPEGQVKRKAKFHAKRTGEKGIITIIPPRQESHHFHQSDFEKVEHATD